MARLFSFQDGNFTAANGWKNIDTTSFLMSVAGTTATTTSYVASTAFTPGAITVEGVGLFVANTAVGPTGTLDVQLWNSTGGSQVALVTINLSDLPSNGTQFAYFKFSAPVLLLAATNYQIRIRSSVAGTVTFNRDGTAGNWARFLVLNTTATAVAGDDFFVMGEHTGAGTFNARTMTMDINSTSNYGFMVTGNHGVINFPTNANTQLRLSTEYIGTSSTCFLHSGNAIVNQGTSVAPIQSGFTSIMYQTATGAANRVYAITGSAVYNIYGENKRRITTLAATVSAGATSLTTNDTTSGWLVGDQIVITGTRRVTTHAEVRTTTSVGANIAGWTTGLTNARDGAAIAGVAANYVPGTVAAHIGNLTSNAIIRGVSTTLTCGVRIQQAGTMNANNALIINHGGTGNGTISVQSATATLMMDECAFVDGTAASTICVGYTGTANFTTGSITLTNNVFYNFQLYGFAITSASVLTGTYDKTKFVLEDNLFCLCLNASGAMVYSLVNPVTLRRNILNECRSTSLYALNINLANNVIPNDSYDVVGNIIYNNVLGMGISARNNKDTNNPWSGNVVFRNTSIGAVVNGSYNSTISSDRYFGNALYNLAVSPGFSESTNLDFVNLSISGETSYASQSGIALSLSASTVGGALLEADFFNCSIGVASGSATSHTTADIAFFQPSTSVIQFCKLGFDDCLLGSTVKVSNSSRISRGSYLKFRNFNATNNDHRAHYTSGILQTDTVITRSSPRSARLTPSTSFLSTDFASRKYAMKAGQSAVVGCYIRTSVVGDGAAYNGSLPQIILKRNYSLGILNDSVIGTATIASSGAWELVTGNIPAVDIDGVVEICVRCNGTTGWVNVEDFK